MDPATNFEIQNKKGTLEKPSQDENLVMDFSNAFKTKAKRGGNKKPLSDVNADLEDANLREVEGVQEIPRNLTIT